MHAWSFFRAGGFDQVKIANGADVAALGSLDPKLWAALACPVRGVEFDEATLDRIDTDGDGRIRAPDVVAAAAWMAARLHDLDELFAGHDALPLTALRTDTPEGARLLTTARQILAELGRSDQGVISVKDTSDLSAVFAAQRFNGDGVVPPTSADDPEVRAFLEDILVTVGGVSDRSGAIGVDQAHLDAFLAAAADRDAWWRAAADDTTVLPLGDATAAAHDALQAVAAKIDDWFARVRLATFEPRLDGALGGTPDELAAIAARQLTAEDAEVARLPLARVDVEGRLPLGAGINPAWAARIARFKSLVVGPLIGDRTSLDEADWSALRAAFAPYEAWAAGAKGNTVAALPPARLTAVLTPDLRTRVEALLRADEALRDTAEAIGDVDRLVRYHRDLVPFLHNFVAFKDFYTRSGKAIFQVGTLYVDQRSSELCLRVDDMGRHAALAGRAGTYLAYCDVTRKASGEQMKIVAAITGGDADNLMVGRNGLFLDRKGRDWDATIVQIVEHPISLRQAFWTPYKRVARLIEQQFEKFAASKAAAVDSAAELNVTSGADAVTAAAPAPPPPPAAFDVAKFAGIFAAIGLAIGAIGGALGAIVTALSALAWWKLPIVLAGVVLAISGPSMLMAALRLRKRNLAPLLDASGWAVNANARMNIPFGESLTGIAHLPAGARRTLDDPFAESRRGRWVTSLLVVLAVLVGLWWFGVLERVAPWLPDSPRAIGTAPAATAAPTPPAAPAPAAAP